MTLVDRRSVTAPTIGETIHRLRRCARVTQIKLGTVLGLHQTAICRIEADQQRLTTDQIKTVSEFFGISIDQIFLGQINFWQVAQQFGTRPPFSDRYRLLPHSKVRGLLPILFFLNDTQGEKFTHHLLASYEMDSILFSDPDQPISTYFELDLLHELLQQKVITFGDLERLVSQVARKQLHDTLNSTYEAQKTPLRLVQSWVLNSDRYNNNFVYDIESQDRSSILLSITANPHMRQLQYKDRELQDFYCRYHVSYLSQFPTLAGQQPLRVAEEQCHFHGDSERCVYLLTAG